MTSICFRYFLYLFIFCTLHWFMFMINNSYIHKISWWWFTLLHKKLSIVTEGNNPRIYRDFVKSLVSKMPRILMGFCTAFKIRFIHCKTIILFFHSQLYDYDYSWCYESSFEMKIYTNCNIALSFLLLYPSPEVKEKNRESQRDWSWQIIQATGI